MTKLEIKNIATSYTSIIFLVIGITGVMMYFHLNSKLVKELHEVLGLVFVIAALLHVLMNWKSMRSYFKKRIFITAFLIISIISTIFISQSINKGDSPKAILIDKVLNASLNDSFKLINGDYENAVKKLQLKNIEIFEAKNINEIAKEYGISPFKIVKIIATTDDEEQL